jgi:methylated-DNA-[protein]-cysteine S-methyltransferase
MDGLRDTILSDFPLADEDDSLLPELVADLRRYFAGERVEFAADLHWDGVSPFVKAVWQACRAIPYGQTVSYGELAARVGHPGAARAVGMAMGRNPCPIVVPCHRVLARDGSLGGYSGPGGVEFKRTLLEMEAGAPAEGS